MIAFSFESKTLFGKEEALNVRIWFLFTDVNECELFPCQNGGTCRNTAGGYVCECMPGWEGKDCEHGKPCLAVWFYTFSYISRLSNKTTRVISHKPFQTLMNAQVITVKTALHVWMTWLATDVSVLLDLKASTAQRVSSECFTFFHFPVSTHEVRPVGRSTNIVLLNNSKMAMICVCVNNGDKRKRRTRAMRPRRPAFTNNF